MKSRSGADSRQEGIREVAEELPVRLQLKRYDKRSEEVESVLCVLRERTWKERGRKRLTHLEERSAAFCRLHHVRRRRRWCFCRRRHDGLRRRDKEREKERGAEMRRRGRRTGKKMDGGQEGVGGEDEDERRQEARAAPVPDPLTTHNSSQFPTWHSRLRHAKQGRCPEKFLHLVFFDMPRLPPPPAASSGSGKSSVLGPAILATPARSLRPCRSR